MEIILDIQNNNIFAGYMYDDYFGKYRILLNFFNKVTSQIKD